MTVFRTFGELALTADDGRELRSILAQPKRLALLAYLASPRTPVLVSRDALVGMFWPERDESRARNALRTSLSFLRRSLGPDTLTARGEREVGLDPGRLRCDAAELAAALKAGDDALALELYGGEYLAGLVVRSVPEFERWIDGERRRFRLQARDAGRRLAEGALARGDGDEAERRARRAAALDPWDEATLRLLMRVLADRGNRAEALWVFGRFADRAREELGLEPSADSEALAARIRGGRATAGAGSSAADPEGAGPPAAKALPSSVPAPTREAGPAEAPPVAGGRVFHPRRWRRWAAAAVVLAAATAFLAYRTRDRLSSADAAGRVPVTAGPETRTIAVLPLEDFSPEAPGAYFAGALTDELTSALSVVPGFQVVSRTSASEFAGSGSVGAPAMADSLGVRYLVEGDVLRIGDSVAIIARLVDGPGDRTLWTGRFARLVGETPHLEEDVARRISASLRSSITRREEERIEVGQTEDPVARDLYLRAGDAAPYTIDSASTARAITQLRQAVALDSTFAAAWFRLGIALHVGSRWHPPGGDSTRMALDRAIHFARPPWLRTEYRSRRAELLGERDSVLTLARRAVRMHPGHPELVWNLSEAFRWRGDLPDALVWERRARDLDPLNPARWTALGGTYMGLHLDRRAERAFRHAVAIDSTYARAWGGVIDLRLLHHHYGAALALDDSLRAALGYAPEPAFRGVTYLWMGRAARGRELLERALRTHRWRDIVYAAPEIVRARLATGDTARADSLGRRAEATLRRMARGPGASSRIPSALVELAAVRGRGREAARRLRAYARVPTRRLLRTLVEDPDYAPVRSDTAFQDAVAEVRARIARQRFRALRMLARENRG